MESPRSTVTYTEVRIPASGVRTLAWRGDVLVDWAAGHVEYHLDGTMCAPVYTSYGPRFDAVVTSRDGRNVVIYDRFGTKGALLRDGRMVRELDRSFYHAEVYELPVELVDLPSGDVGVVHCPKEYNRLEIDDVVSGRRVTEAERDPADFFHSALSTSPNGRRFASAGWVWHPWQAVEVFDVDDAIRTPRALDTGRYLSDISSVANLEVTSMAWLTEDIVALASSSETDEPDADDEPGPLKPSGLTAIDLRTGACLSSVVLPEVAGAMVGLDRDHVISFHGHPKLIRVDTGEVLARWPHLASGRRPGCLRFPDGLTPPRAFDRANRRFAIASANEIVVVQLGPPPVTGRTSSSPPRSPA